jgi:ATP-dependent DNA helicase RecQ
MFYFYGMSLIHQILAQYWGYNQFRPLQEDIIRSVMSGNDTVALLPTGGGKSLCFQVPAMSQPGLCLVISPLIALMKDQEEHLLQKGIRAHAIVSGMKKCEVERALNNCIYGDYKFLYVSPERLLSPIFREYLLQMKLNLIAVDEAHCISQWGYDFRPPYLQIAEIRENFPKVPILALTASATPEVKDDIIEKLELTNVAVYAKSFARSNISYIVRETEDKMTHLFKVLDNMPGSSIVYVRNRRKTQEMADAIRKHGISANFYHAGLNHQTRAERQMQWKNDQTRVIVATNAFGMGIDKPNVRTVIHMDLPDDLESYYQEAGRAGRDEKPSYAVVLYDKSDFISKDKRLLLDFPPREEIRRVYKALGNYLQIPLQSGFEVIHTFDLVEFCAFYSFDNFLTYNCLKILELADYISLSESIFLPARLRILVNSNDLYVFQVQNQKFDHLIKIILRSYTGLFDDYVRFSETELAQRAGITLSELIQQLNYLQKVDVLEFIPAIDKPTLTFTQNRVDEKEIIISKAILEERKERFVLRAQAFKNFLINQHECRSMILLNYFGESQLVRCGTCDYCRDRNKIELNDIEMEELCHQIRHALLQSPMDPDQLSEHFKHIPLDHFKTVLKWLLDTDELGIDIVGKVYCKLD